MGFTFLHIADVHLDTPFQTKKKELRFFLREAIRATFQAAVDLALSKGVDAVLIAGDLFDNNTLSFATERFILEQMQKLNEAHIAVFYAPGNHDPSRSMNRLGSMKWPENVKIFHKRIPVTYPVYNREGHIVAVVSGAGHEHNREGENLVKRFPQAQDKGIPHVGLVHALVTGATGEEEHERYAPCTMDDLLDKGYIYWALGHIHSKAELSHTPLVVYPGNIVGRHFREQGLKGAYLVEIDDTGEVRSTFHSLAPVRWILFSIKDISKAETLEDLQETMYGSIIQQLEGEKDAGEVLARISLEGPSPLYRELRSEENVDTLKEDLSIELGFRHLEIVVSQVTRPVIPDDYKGQPHVLGTALDILEMAKTDPDLLLELKPERLGGCSSLDSEETIDYLKGLLEGLDYEVVARLLEEGVL
jgi:exonuclease SbcD